METRGGEGRESALLETSFGLSMPISILHHEKLPLMGRGFLIVIQQGPVSFLFSKNNSSELLVAPKIRSIQPLPEH